MFNKKSLALKLYRKNAFNLCIALVPIIYFCIGIAYSIFAKVGLLPGVNTAYLMVFNVANILYVVVGLFLSFFQKSNDDDVKFRKKFNIGRIFLFVSIFLQYNYILHTVPCFNFLAYGFLFCILISLFLDYKTLIATIIQLVLSTLISWIVNPEVLLQINDYHKAALIDSIICFTFQVLALLLLAYLIKKYLILLRTSEIEEQTGMYENELGKESKARKEAEEEANAKNEFVTQISHEIRTPVNIILGINQMIQKDLADNSIDTESILDYSNNIELAGNTLLSLINSMTNINKIKAGEIKLNEENYPAQLLIKNVTSILTTRAKQKQLKAIVNIDENIPKGLYGDTHLIEEILDNFISNSIKYTKEGYVAFNVTLLENSDGYATIRYSISDSGIGIKDTVLNKIKETLQNVNTSTDFTMLGTGFGINISQRYLLMMNSSVKIESEYGKGSTFFFDLKQKIIDGNKIGNTNSIKQATTENTKSYVQRFSIQNARILIVDDVEVNLKVAEGLIKHLGATIDLALSAESAIEECKRYNYDIIFMDQMMPDVDGITASREIRKISDYYNKVPIVALTASAESGEKEKLLNAGLNDYLAKPIERTAFENIILKWLPDNKVTKLIEETQEEIKEKQEYEDIINDDPDLIIPEIDDLDKEEALIKLGNERAYKNALMQFVENSDEFLIMLQNAVIALDNDLLKDELKELISSMSAICAESIVGSCEYLLVNCDELTSYEIKTKASEIIERVLKLKDNIQSVLSYNENISYATTEELHDNGIFIDDLRNFLISAIKACEENNIGELTRIVTLLSSYKIKGSERYMFALDDALSASNIVTANQVLSAWFSSLDNN